jgi:molybdopterin/thiamine biosynthesis adenylyltransferase
VNERRQADVDQARGPGTNTGVLLIGAGGLGCGTALGLGAAGVERVGIVDDDVVDESNLHRQVGHRAEQIGVAKATSLAEDLRARFPGMKVETFRTRFTADNAAALLANFAVLVDGSDNLGTKFLANDAAVLAKKPLVHAAAVGTVGQLLSVPAGGRPCYRCLFEELPPPDADALSCAEAGVLGPVPGVLGALQAAEAVRFLRGEAPAFAGQLLQYDSFGFSLRRARFRRNPSCRVCGDAASITALVQDHYDGESCRA